MLDIEAGIRYAASTADSWVSFEAQSTLHDVHGKSSDLDGGATLAWNPGDTVASSPAPAIHVEVPVDRLRSGNEMQDREMRKLIDSRRFPRIVAELRSLGEPSASGRYPATGEITIVGRKRVYSGELQIARDGDTVTIDGALTLDIRDFGLTPPRLLLIKVEPQLRVQLHLVVRKAG